MAGDLILSDVNTWRFPPRNRAETCEYTGLRVLLFHRVTSDSISQLTGGGTDDGEANGDENGDDTGNGEGVPEEAGGFEWGFSLGRVK